MYLLDGGVLHHVNDKQAFDNSSSIYRFRCDDGTYYSLKQAFHLAQNGTQIYRRLHGVVESIIHSHTYLLKTYKLCFVGTDFVEWLIEQVLCSLLHFYYSFSYEVFFYCLYTILLCYTTALFLTKSLSIASVLTYYVILLHFYC